MLLLVKILLNIPKGLSRNGGFSYKKRPFSAANISKKKADFGPTRKYGPSSVYLV
jgi:hypothetical protein